jgi:site-specific recombinase XerD
MKLSTAIDLLYDATAAEGRSERTLKGYRSTLGYLLAFLGDVDVDAVTITDLRRYAAELRGRSTRYADNPYAATQQGGLSPFTVASYLRGIKRLFNWLTEEGVLTTNPAQRLRVQTPQRREPKAVDLEDFRRLLAATADNTPDDIRDRALLLLLADTGARAGGVCHLRLGDVDPARMTVRLTEKGEKTRVVPLSETTVAAVAAWLVVRPAVDVNWIFVTLGPRNYGARLSEDGLKEVLRRLKRQSGVKGRVNPHSFRHGFAREWIRNGGDIATLARILGHSDPAVTARFYSVFSDQELTDFHRRFSPVARMSASLPSPNHDSVGS